MWPHEVGKDTHVYIILYLVYMVSLLTFSGHFECPPYDQSTLRSTYHVRSCDLFQLKQVMQTVKKMYVLIC